MGKIGFSVNVDKDAIDNSQPLMKSVYVIQDPIGQVLFVGFVDVPNCK